MAIGVGKKFDIGLILYEGTWVSRPTPLNTSVEIKPNMYFAIETFAENSNVEQTVRLEQDMVVTDTGHEMFRFFPFEEDFVS